MGTTKFGGTAKVLQSYFAVAFIVIWLCSYLVMILGKRIKILNILLFFISYRLGLPILLIIVNNNGIFSGIDEEDFTSVPPEDRTSR